MATGTGAARADGPFDYYSDLHGGGAKVTAASIRGLVNDPAQDAATIHTLAGDLDRDTHLTGRLVEGQIRHDVAAAPKRAAAHARQLSANATYAIGVVNLFANHVETFDTEVDRLNSEYNSHLGALRMAAIEAATGVPVPPALQRYVHTSGTPTPTPGSSGSPLSSLTQPNPQMTVPLRPRFDVAAAAAAYRSHLMPQWRHAHHRLERHADQIATMLRKDVSNERIRDLIDAGALPLSAAALFPGLRLARADREANYAAALRGISIASGAPAAVYAWWGGLSAAQREALVARMPGSIGNLDGVPIVYRDRANRAVLPTELTKLRQGRDALIAKYGGKPPEYGDPSFWDGMKAGIFGETPHGDANPDYDRYQQLGGLIKGSEALQHHLDQRSDPPYFLIGYDPESGNGHAVISRGNPDTATNVISYVPGTKTSLGGIDGGISRSDIMMRQAIYSGAPQRGTAAITWYGYDAPQSIPDAAHIRYADAGRDALTNFQAGLRTTHDGSPAYTLIVGHSYGTTLIGDAATHGTLDADRVALVASPGADADHASDLHLDGAATPGITDRVYATKATHDPVPLYGHVDPGAIGSAVATEVANPALFWTERGLDVLTGHHHSDTWPEHMANTLIDGHPEGGPFGPDPAGPDFGAATLPSDPGTGGHWYLGYYSGDVHKQYWVPGNNCLIGLGHLAANR